MKGPDRLWEVRRLSILLLWFSGAALLYLFIFNNQHLAVNLGVASNYIAALYTLIVILLAATLYGNAVSIILRCTLEKAIGCGVSAKE